MIIKPKVRGFMCITAHPSGCAASVAEQIAHVRAGGPIANGPKRVLVIGASTGYGLASRIAAAFGCGAATVGIFFEKEGSEGKCGTAGWYNSAAFHEEAEAAGLRAWSLNGDAFSTGIKQKTIELIARELGQVDLVVYSLAAPRRTHPVTGVTHKSTLKPIGKRVEERTLDTDKREIKHVAMDAASDEEIADTVAVMGGEDWEMWIDALAGAGVLAPGARTTAYTYLGDRITWDIYWDGTIGAAKKDLDTTSVRLNGKLAALGGKAYVSVLKAVVTQASSAIPIMPLYLALLFKVMKARGTHEGCIEQVDGLFRTALLAQSPVLDDAGRLRMDGKELVPEVQREVEQLWPRVETGNIDELTDFAGYQQEFLRLFGFGFPGVDYDAEVDPVVPIANLVA
jgi:enoyl-[acyl-carrier protein] reductase / trans-2-enoyl-CoA reductase (NAD+)